MREFIEAIVSFPTIVYTALLGVVVIYWGTVVVGILDVDFFDPGAKLDAAAHGALEGAHDGALDGAHDGALDGGHDGAFEGAHEGHLDGAHDGGLDGGHDAGLDAGHHGSGHETDVGDHGNDGHAAGHGLLALLGARGVPVTVSISLLVLWSWFLSGMAMHFVRGVLPAGALRVLAGCGVGVGALVAGGMLTRLAVKPLRRAFPQPTSVRKRSILGMPCRITTLKVTDRFGQAEVEDGGAGIIVQVRCREANALRKGSLALIVHHDDEQDVFHVLPEEEKPL